MKKILSILLVLMICFSASACNVKFQVKGKIPSPTEPVSETQSTTVDVAEPTVSVENTYETIEVTEPEKTSKDEAIEILHSYGFNKNDLRRKYTFDESDLNSTNSKWYVLDRMSNSVDYFTTLQVAYTKKENLTTTLVSYAIDRRINKAKEIKYNISNSEKKCIPENYVCVDGNYHLKMLFKDDIKKNYTFDFDYTLENPDSEVIENIKTHIQKEFSDELSSTSNEPYDNSCTDDEVIVEKYLDITRRFTLVNGTPIYALQRGDTISLIYSDENYFPQYFALEALHQLSDWSIDKIEKSGMSEIIHISGKFTGIDEIDNTYKLCVDKNTGVVISKQIFNMSGNIVEEWKNIYYIADGEIDKNIFEDIEVKN